MNLSHKFIQIIRSGRLNALRRLFDAGLQLDLHDLQGDAALAMGMACHMGHKEIVRELFTRGVPLNLPDNRHPTSPLSMAIRSRKRSAFCSNWGRNCQTICPAACLPTKS